MTGSYYGFISSNDDLFVAEYISNNRYSTIETDFIFNMRTGLDQYSCRHKNVNLGHCNKDITKDELREMAKAKSFIKEYYGFIDLHDNEVFVAKSLSGNKFKKDGSNYSFNIKTGEYINGIKHNFQSLGKVKKDSSDVVLRTLARNQGLININSIFTNKVEKAMEKSFSLEPNFKEPKIDLWPDNMMRPITDVMACSDKEGFVSLNNLKTKKEKEMSVLNEVETGIIHTINGIDIKSLNEAQLLKYTSKLQENVDTLLYMLAAKECKNSKYLKAKRKQQKKVLKKVLGYLDAIEVKGSN